MDSNHQYLEETDATFSAFGCVAYLDQQTARERNLPRLRASAS